MNAKELGQSMVSIVEISAIRYHDATQYSDKSDLLRISIKHKSNLRLVEKVWRQFCRRHCQSCLRTDCDCFHPLPRDLALLIITSRRIYHRSSCHIPCARFRRKP